MTSTADIRQELRAAVKMLSGRGLKIASKWAAELLVGLDSSKAAQGGKSFMSTTSAPSGSNSHIAPTVEPDEDSDVYMLAKGLFDCGEYQRAAEALKNSPTSPWGGGEQASASRGVGGEQVGTPGWRKALFLRSYALFLAGEKRKEEQMVERGEGLERCFVENAHLKALRLELVEHYENGLLDGLLLYLLGVVLREGGAAASTGKSGNGTLDCKQILVDAVVGCPYNWSAWLDLAALGADNTVSF